MEPRDEERKECKQAATEKRPGVRTRPVLIAVTADTVQENRDKCAKVGFDHFIGTAN